jgi:hypothetical protein
MQHSTLLDRHLSEQWRVSILVLKAYSSRPDERLTIKQHPCECYPTTKSAAVVPLYHTIVEHPSPNYMSAGLGIPRGSFPMWYCSLLV